MPTQRKKCDLKQCLCREPNGYCTNDLPNMIESIVPDSIKCPYYDEDFKKTFKNFMEHGGVLGALATINGKKIKEEEFDEKGNKIRKPRADKGKKRERKEKARKKRKKEENSLQEIL
jgi:hypothetical protein